MAGLAITAVVGTAIVYAVAWHPSDTVLAERPPLPAAAPLDVPSAPASPQAAAPLADVRASTIASDGDDVYVTVDDALHAVTARNGDHRWVFDAPGWVTSAPTVVGTTVLVSGDRSITALSRDAGQTVWHTDLELTLHGQRPLVSGDVAVVVGARSTPGGAAAVAVGFDVDTGAERWRTVLDAVETRHAIAAGDHVVVGLRTPQGPAIMTAVSADDGTVRWRTELPGVETPVLATDDLVIGLSRRTVVALDREDGAVRWRAEPEVARRASLRQALVRGDRLLVVAAGIRWWERSFDLATGADLGTRRLVPPDVEGPAGDDAYFLTRSVATWAVERGRMVWLAPLTDRVASDVTADHVRVMVVTTAGELVAFERRSGIRWWRIDLTG